MNRRVLVVHGPNVVGSRPDGWWKDRAGSRDGDSTITSEARSATSRGDSVTVVTADRLLQAAVHSVGASTMSPSWLLDLLGR